MRQTIRLSVWSLVLRRKQQDNRLANILQNLITDGRVIMIGAVREILSGIKHQKQFEKLKDNLRAFPDLALSTEDYKLAAKYFNVCRRQGIQGSNTDFLIYAIANKRNYEIFTTDNDFIGFSQYLPIVLIQL